MFALLHSYWNVIANVKFTSRIPVSWFRLAYYVWFSWTMTTWHRSDVYSNLCASSPAAGIMWWCDNRDFDWLANANFRQPSFSCGARSTLLDLNFVSQYLCRSPFSYSDSTHTYTRTHTRMINAQTNCTLSRAQSIDQLFSLFICLMRCCCFLFFFSFRIFDQRFSQDIILFTIIRTHFIQSRTLTNFYDVYSWMLMCIQNQDFSSLFSILWSAEVPTKFNWSSIECEMNNGCARQWVKQNSFVVFIVTKYLFSTYSFIKCGSCLEFIMIFDRSGKS